MTSAISVTADSNRQEHRRRLIGWTGFFDARPGQSAYRRFAGVCVLVLSCLSTAAAQPPAQNVATGTAASPTVKSPVASEANVAGNPGSAPTVQEQEPAFYLAPDDQGKLRPIINLPLERIERLLKLDQKRKQEVEPSFALSMSATGKVEHEHAELTIAFEIRLLRDDWIRVPLRLDEALLLPDSVEHEGVGEAILIPDPSAAGYACWVRGKTGNQCRLRVRALVPVLRAGDEARLHLTPPALTSVNLKITVPEQHLAARVPANAVIETKRDEAANTTSFEVVSGPAPLDLVWWPRDDVEQARLPALEATSSISVEIKDRQIETSALVSVRSLDRPFDRFRMRLPEGALLKSSNGHRYSAIRSTTAAVDAEGPADWVYEILLEQPVRQADVQLVSERTDVPLDTPVQLAGFTVLDAHRQTGQIAISTTGDWQLAWGEQQNVHRAAEGELPPELRRMPVTAAFRFVAQPASLMARIRKRRPKLTVEPSCMFLVERDRERLDARLKYHIAGATVSSVSLNWPETGWEIEEIGPATAIDEDQFDPTDRTPLIIPLKQPRSGNLEITIRARRVRPADQKQVSLDPPTPLADQVKPLAFVIGAADNVRLTPVADAIRGLVRQPSGAVKGFAGLQQEPVYYRSDGRTPHFVADLKVLPRVVTAESVVHVQARQNRWQVEQQFIYQIANESLGSLAFEIPAGVTDPEQISVMVDDRALIGKSVSVNRVHDKLSELQVNLSIDRIGACKVVLTFSVPAPPITDHTVIRLPLLIPRLAKVERSTATIVAGDGVVVKGAAGWNPAGDMLANQVATDTVFVGKGAINELPLQIERAHTNVTNPLVVERTWIQSWLTDSERQDRVVFRLQTNRKQIVAELPAGALSASLQVLVNGRRTAPRRQTPERFSIPLVAEVDQAGSTVELIYRLESPPIAGVELAIAPAKLVDTDLVRRTYWQLILPEDRYAVTAPIGFASESDWAWDRYLWRRRPLMSQAELESWAGSRHESPLDTNVNSYLYSTLGTPGILRVAAMERAFLVLAASGSALLLGILMIQIPLLRNSIILLAIGVTITGFAFAQPGTALLLGQAAMLGIALAAMAAVLKRVTSHRPAGAFAMRRPTSSIVKRGSTRTQPHMSPVTGSNSSTKTTVSIELAHDSKR